jgi:hypothetical protein
VRLACDKTATRVKRNGLIAIVCGGYDLSELFVIGNALMEAYSGLSKWRSTGRAQHSATSNACQRAVLTSATSVNLFCSRLIRASLEPDR